jgi:hypothetical protein
VLAPSAQADDPPAAQASPPSPRSVLVDVGAGTYLPLVVGAEATGELPYRILLQGDAGWMPAAYSSAVVDLLGDFGALTSPEQTLIKDAIQNAFAARLSVGWRPFSKLGLEILAGYTLLTAGGTVTAADILDSFLTSTGSTDRFTGVTNEGVPLRATLHNIHATIDWRFLFLNDHLVLRVSVGYIQCLASSLNVSASPTRPFEQAATNRLNSELAAYLNPYFTEYVKAPLVGLNLAYRF